MSDFPAEFPSDLDAPDETIRFRLFLSDGSRISTDEHPSWAALFVNDGRWVRTSTGQLVNPLHVIRIVTS